MKSLRHLYKIGNGPSSSHTMGPEYASHYFIGVAPDAEMYKVILYGSLALTGKGHLTDVSIKEVSDIMDYNDINNYVEIVLKNNSFLVDNIIPEFITASDLKYLLTCLVKERVSIKKMA